VFVIDDGLPTSWSPPTPEFGSGAVEVIKGIKPFVFSRNCNLGIKAAGADDVVLLNDDALLKTVWGFTTLSKSAPVYGVVAAVTNKTGNAPQRQTAARSGVRATPLVAFICVYLRRRLIDEIGLLDEDYAGYGRDDDDYCYRVRKQGFWVGVCDGCFVDHASLPSAYRDTAGQDTSFIKSDATFLRKHGITHEAALSVSFATIPTQPLPQRWTRDDLMRIYGARAVVFVDSNMDAQEIRKLIVESLPRARVLCGNGYQRNSIRETICALLPGHRAFGAFWWKIL
jgi:hypothetical protein